MPKLAILSDIHGNIEALEAVLEDLEALQFDKMVILGDTVGYGPNPRECWQKVWEIADMILIGNHEKEAVIPDKYGMCGDAKIFLDWSIEQIKDDANWQKLAADIETKGFHPFAYKTEENMLFVHASPKRPVTQYVWPGHESHYIIYHDQIDDRLWDFFNEFKELHCFHGHTHVPAVLISYEHRLLFDFVPWHRRATFIGPKMIFFVPDGDNKIKELKDKKAMINPGSVGQPRDDNPAASYIIYDGDNVEFRRVGYDFRKTQKKILDLPLDQEYKEFFAQRLAKGQ